MDNVLAHLPALVDDMDDEYEFIKVNCSPQHDASSASELGSDLHLHRAAKRRFSLGILKSLKRHP